MRPAGGKRHDLKHINLDIYREYYADSPLADIWDKITHVLENHGLSQNPAEQAGLQLTEWIRTTWGGLILTERRIGDSRQISRFDLLRDRTVAVLDDIAPALANKAAVAAEIVRVVRVDYRGKYITRVKSLDQLQRNIDIFNRANTAAQMEEMAIKHNISVVRAYQINAALLKSKEKREQPLLPFG